MRQAMKTLVTCSGNLLHPQRNGDATGSVLERSDLAFDDLPIIGEGTYGQVYRIGDYAVKKVTYRPLDLSLACLIRETVVLAMLGRLRFIGLNQSQYYIGMDYLPGELNAATAMQQLAEELALIHSTGIIHGDIKPARTVRVDSAGTAHLIDFGSCRFWVGRTFTGTNPYCDYLLLDHPEAMVTTEADVWAMGVVFYMLETQRSPWELPAEDAAAIEHQWPSAMQDVSPLVKGMLSLKHSDRWTVAQIVEACTQ